MTTKVNAATGAAAAKIRNLQEQIDRLKGKLLYVDVYERVHTAPGAPALGGKPAYASGSWKVPATGLALIHKNEMIIPAVPAARIRQGGGMAAAPNITVNLYGQDDGRRIVATLERYFAAGNTVAGGAKAMR